MSYGSAKVRKPKNVGVKHLKMNVARKIPFSAIEIELLK